MHALILGLVHERLDPALVVAHAAEAGEMVDRGADHPRHRGDRFQNDSTVAVTLGEKGVGAPPQNLGEAVSYAIGQTLGVVMDAEIDERCSHWNISVPAAGVGAPSMGTK